MLKKVSFSLLCLCAWSSSLRIWGPSSLILFFSGLPPPFFFQRGIACGDRSPCKEPLLRSWPTKRTSSSREEEKTTFAALLFFLIRDRMTRTLFSHDEPKKFILRSLFSTYATLWFGSECVLWASILSRRVVNHRFVTGAEMRAGMTIYHGKECYLWIWHLIAFVVVWMFLRL